MKKKTNWKVIAGLAVAALTFLKFSEDLPVRVFDQPEAPDCPRQSTAKWDDEAKVWRCVPKGVL
jgi:hypothetical protein